MDGMDDMGEEGTVDTDFALEHVYRLLSPEAARRCRSIMVMRDDGLAWVPVERGGRLLFLAKKKGVCVGTLTASHDGVFGGGCGWSGWDAYVNAKGGGMDWRAPTLYRHAFFASVAAAADCVARIVDERSTEDPACGPEPEQGPIGATNACGDTAPDNPTPGFHKSDGVDGKPGVWRDEHPDVLVGLDGAWVQVDDVTVPLGTAGWDTHDLPMDVRVSLCAYAQRTLEAYDAEMRAAEGAQRCDQAARITSVARSLEKYNRGGQDDA